MQQNKVWHIMCIFIVNKRHAGVCKIILRIKEWQGRIKNKKYRLKVFNKITVFNIKITDKKGKNRLKMWKRNDIRIASFYINSRT